MCCILYTLHLGLHDTCIGILAFSLTRSFVLVFNFFLFRNENVINLIPLLPQNWQRWPGPAEGCEGGGPDPQCERDVIRGLDPQWGRRFPEDSVTVNPDCQGESDIVTTLLLCVYVVRPGIIWFTAGLQLQSCIVFIYYIWLILFLHVAINFHMELILR